MTRSKRDAADQLEYEDTVLPRLLRALDDRDRDIDEHGRIVKLVVERMAVRQTARELIGKAIASVPELSEFSAHLRARTPEDRRSLAHLDEMTRSVAPQNINQGQDVDRVIEDIAGRLLAEMEEERSHLIPAVRAHVGRQRREKLLPRASYVLRHCPLHPGAHQRRWYDEIGPLRWAHAVYDYLRSLPVGGVKPGMEVAIPGEGVVPAATDRTASTPVDHPPAL